MRPAEDVERLGVADGAHGLLVHRDEVVARLDAAVARQRAARSHRPARGECEAWEMISPQPTGLWVQCSPRAAGNYDSTFPYR